MKNHELLDLIGGVDEDHVLAADRAVKPRRAVRWRAWAAAAACAALALCAYPVWRGAQPGDLPSGQTVDAPETPRPEPERTLVQRPGLHEYTLVEEERRIMSTQGEAPGGAGIDVPGQKAPEPGSGPDSASGDVPVQEAGADQAGKLYAVYQSAGTNDPMLKWFGGAWINQSGGLTVAVVEGWRNAALERQIEELAGAVGAEPAIVYADVKYPQRLLDGLMDQVAQVFEELEVRISSAYGVYVMDNYLGLDFFGAVPSDEVLAALAQLDPEGDALRIQVFRNGSLQLTDEAAKGPAQPHREPVEPMVEPEPTPVPAEEGERPAVPGGAREEQPTAGQEGPQAPETCLPAVAPEGGDLPQAKYDVIYGADG